MAWGKYLSAVSLTLYALFPTTNAWLNNRTKVPALGFNPWNAFGCDIDETLFRNTALLMKNLGLQDAGYEYVNLDDCWLLTERDSSGKLAYDPARFPNGLLNLTTFIHDLGLKAGIYEDQGTNTCAGFAGSLGFEDIDAFTFFDWGFDYVKIDNCASGSFNGTNPERFQRWTDALLNLHNATGGMLAYSLVEWQGFDAWTWAPPIANSWRIYDDIQPNWGRIMEILNNASFLGNFTDHFAHNDLDMLEVGHDDLTLTEQRSHFTAWALNKSPLLIGTDLSIISNDSLAILKNKEILAINQDEFVGSPLKPFFWGRNPDNTWDPSFPAQYWSGFFGPQGQTAIMYINVNEEPEDISFSFSQSPHLKTNTEYSIRDLWAHKERGVFKGSFTEKDVEPHDVRAYLFTEVTP